MSNTEAPGNLYLTSGNDTTPTAINHVEPTASLKTLGVFTSPSRSFAAQFATTTNNLSEILTDIKAAPMTIFKHLCWSWSIYTPNSDIYLQRLSYEKEISLPQCQHVGADLTQEILQTKQSLPFLFHHLHVKLHKYDEQNDPTKIPFLNWINKQCNIAADSAYYAPDSPTTTSPLPLPTTKSYLLLNDILITTNIQKFLRHAEQDNLLKE